MDVSRETMARLEIFAALLERWNQRINLVSPKDLAQLWPRHIEDSLQLAEDMPPGMPFVDLGSGGGFPGLILAIATGNPVTLVESDQRKASFLREAARSTGTNATVVAKRIEDAEIGPAGVITARALAPLPLLLEWAKRFLQPDGVCLFLKGRNAEDELTAARAEWHMTISRRPSRSSSDGVILRLSEIRRVKEPDRATGR
ncbi:16S rRNA (guanine(527)-N(7))-methyltransferase RsmG [Acetobacteraceae bacterium KSS8]|uniref:Ribosomal RNA small subunit methyltransferase G n=1 Tax=Endosaccharibacter trunci TaxID=2812733 RepID=A0ABT1WDL6_9PROT|nr:16S rRNA (guanine(527)-N(7))-methyltransferase RsmG [Acetobacteraceae bacterium KSS8]